MSPMPTAILALTLAMLSTSLLAADPSTGGFSDFDRRAKAGERLNVVFFGASLTWGANASDQSETSYRALVRNRLAERYPAAHFRCRDAAIGGTGSQLGAFRLERDVLAHHPDLVFVDFTANDDIYKADPESLSSYESILRRLAAAGIPVVQVAFPFRWNIKSAELPTMLRRTAHHALAGAYGNGWGDAVGWICQEVDAQRMSLDEIWPTDGVHPDDPGYRAFATVAFTAFVKAVEDGLVPRVPAQPLHPATYLSLRRVLLTSLPRLPDGWHAGRPNLVALYHDFQMSRWLDSVAVAGNRVPDARGKPGKDAQVVAPLRLTVQAASIILLGEGTPASGRYRVRIDGVVLTGNQAQVKDTDLFDANRWKTGNGHYVVELARNLDPAVGHLLEIEPVFDPATAQELRLESICVAGGAATVVPVP